MKIVRNLRTLLKNPRMCGYWLRWIASSIGMRPTIRQPGGELIGGFRNFSEFWGGRNMIPSASEIAFINRYAGESGVLVDVGANLGCMVFALARARPACDMYAFEPSPETVNLLNQNLKINGCEGAKVLTMALGMREGHFAFINDQSSPSTNRLMKLGEPSVGKEIEVQMTTLDEFLKRTGVSDVAFLKIDVEGFEADVLCGAKELLSDSRCKAGLIELCPGNLARVGSSTRELLSVVDGYGYSLRYLNEDGSLGATVTVENAANEILANVALMPK